MIDESNLDAVLKQFDLAEANLSKLERVWSDLSAATGRAREDLVRAFERLAAALPSLDGFKVEATPMSESEISLTRLEAGEVGDPAAHVQAEEAIDEPGQQVADYRFRFEDARSAVVRNRVMEVIRIIDDCLASMSRTRTDGGWPSRAEWEGLESSFGELERLMGSAAPRVARWSDMGRHISFAQEVDLDDIVRMDWPSVKADVERNLYSDLDPVPVQADDLGALVRARPTGPVGSNLLWDQLSAEDFENLIFELVRTSEGYENANWPMKTNAADGGRDVEVHRVLTDSLSGTRRERVIIQCKHWQSKSVSRDDVVLCLGAVKMWEPPRIDVLIMATSGRFTREAVALIERRQLDGDPPRVEAWPDSHLEAMLSRRPQLVARFKLR